MEQHLSDMAIRDIQEQIDSINIKMDIILKEIDHQQKQLQSLENINVILQHFEDGLSSSEKEETRQKSDVTREDRLLQLGRKLLDNSESIYRLFEIMVSIADFWDDSTPITKELLVDLRDRLSEYERKGYFRFMHELIKALDSIIMNTYPGDLQKLGDLFITFVEENRNGKK